MTEMRGRHLLDHSAAGEGCAANREPDGAARRAASAERAVVAPPLARDDSTSRSPDAWQDRLNRCNYRYRRGQRQPCRSRRAPGRSLPWLILRCVRASIRSPAWARQFGRGLRARERRGWRAWPPDRCGTRGIACGCGGDGGRGDAGGANECGKGRQIGRPVLALGVKRLCGSGDAGTTGPGLRASGPLRRRINCRDKLPDSDRPGPCGVQRSRCPSALREALGSPSITWPSASSGRGRSTLRRIGSRYSASNGRGGRTRPRPA